MLFKRSPFEEGLESVRDFSASSTNFLRPSPVVGCISDAFSLSISSSSRAYSYNAFFNELQKRSSFLLVH